MMNRYMILDSTHDNFMILRLYEWQVETIKTIENQTHVGFTIELFDETKHSEYLENWYLKRFCLAIYEKLEISESDEEVIFYIEREGYKPKIFKGTRAQFELIRYFYLKNFEYGWWIDIYEPPTIIDIR